MKTPTPEPAASEIDTKTEELIREFFDHVGDVRQEYAGDHDPRKIFESWAIQKIAELQYTVLHLADVVAELQEWVRNKRGANGTVTPQPAARGSRGAQLPEGMEYPHAAKWLRIVCTEQRCHGEDLPSQPHRT